MWSPWIIAELNRVLVWDWIKRTGNDLSPQNRQACGQAAKAMMAILLPTFTLGAPLPPYPPAWEALSDHWDYPIWVAAKVSNAHYVISENRSDYPPPADDGRYIHENIEDITGRDFPAMLAGE